MKSDLIDLSMQIHAETERAILVSDTGDRDDAVWLPLSQIEVNERRGSVLEVTCPTWLVKDKGLI